MNLKPVVLALLGINNPVMILIMAYFPFSEWPKTKNSRRSLPPLAEITDNQRGAGSDLCAREERKARKEEKEERDDQTNDRGQSPKACRDHRCPRRLQVKQPT